MPMMARSIESCSSAQNQAHGIGANHVGPLDIVMVFTDNGAQTTNGTIDGDLETQPILESENTMIPS